MAGAQSTTVHPSLPGGEISLPFLLLASVLIGAGVFLMALWLVFFNWTYFVGAVFAAVGGVLLFSPRTGPERSGN